jgi:hypothetical protein
MVKNKIQWATHVDYENEWAGPRRKIKYGGQTHVDYENEWAGPQ